MRAVNSRYILNSLPPKDYAMKIFTILSILIMLSGCSTYSVNRYAISADNITELRKLNDTMVNVGEFTSSEPKSEIMCRGVGPIKTPDGDTFSHFIKEALIDELQIAEKYSTDATVSLTGNLDLIDFSSNSGIWKLKLTVNSSNGISVTVSENYSYTTSFYGETACNQTAQALMPAIQNLIATLVNHPHFDALVGAKSYETKPSSYFIP